MRTKQDIVENWLPRYTKRALNDFTKYILLTNFQKYVEIFADHFNVPIVGADANMPNASSKRYNYYKLRNGKCKCSYSDGFA